MQPNAYENVKLETLLAADSRSATANGDGVDTSGFEGLGAVILSAEATDTGTADIYLQHSTEDVSASYTNILDEDGDAVKFTQVTDAANAEEVLPVNFNKTRQYLRARLVIGGGATVVCAVVLASPAKYAPVNYE